MGPFSTVPAQREPCNPILAVHQEKWNSDKRPPTHMSTRHPRAPPDRPADSREGAAGTAGYSREVGIDRQAQLDRVGGEKLGGRDGVLGYRRLVLS